MSLFDFITLPFDLPVNPVWSYIGMAIIGIIAFRLAYWFTGELGGTSNEMMIIHGIVRLIVFVMLWSIVCAIIYVVKFVADYWIYVSIGIGVIVIALIGVFIWKKKRGNENAGNER